MRTTVTQYQFEQIITKLDETISLYVKSKRKAKNYRLFMSDGKTIDFKFTDGDIAHLLGINVVRLSSLNILKSHNSYDMIYEIIESYTRIYQLIKDGKIKFNDIFSEYVDEKLDAFETIINVPFNNFKFMCHYIENRAYSSGTVNTFKCDYYLAMEDKNGHLIYLGFKPLGGYQKNYVPASLLGFTSEEQSNKQMSELLLNQTVTLVNALNIKIDDNIKIDVVKLHLSMSKKLEYMDLLNRIKSKYGCIVDVSNEFSYLTDRLQDAYSKENNVNDVLNLLAEKMKSGQKISEEIIDKLTGSVDDSIIELLGAYNFSQKYGTQTNLSSEIEEITSLRSQLLEAKKRQEEAEERVKIKEELLKSKEALLEVQESELEKLRSFKDDYFALGKKYQG